MLANRTYWTERLIISVNVRQIISTVKIPSTPPFSDFPSDVLKYMKQDATPRQALKMMKLNKYFLQTCFSYIGCFTKLNRDGVTLGYQHLEYGIDELPNNLSIDGSLYVNNCRLLPQLVSKIIICEVTCLIMGAQRISYSDFKVLTASGKIEKLELFGTKVMATNRNEIPYVTLLDHVPNLGVLKFSYDPSKRLSKRFVDKLCESKLETLLVSDLTEVFDLEAFMNALKRKPKLNVQLFFEYSFHARRKVNSYVDKLLAARSLYACPPEIYMWRNGFSRSKDLEKLRSTYLQLNR